MEYPSTLTGSLIQEPTESAVCHRKRQHPSRSKMSEKSHRHGCTWVLSDDVMYGMGFASGSIPKNNVKLNNFLLCQLSPPRWLALHLRGFLPFNVWTPTLEQMAGLNAREVVKLAVSPPQVLPEYMKAKAQATKAYQLGIPEGTIWTSRLTQQLKVETLVLWGEHVSTLLRDFLFKFTYFISHWNRVLCHQPWDFLGSV